MAMLIGIDIGGTECAVVQGDETHIEKKLRFETTSCAETLEAIFQAVREIGSGDAIGISCGGPLDADKGVILSPPNLADWRQSALFNRFRQDRDSCRDAESRSDAAYAAERKCGV